MNLIFQSDFKIQKSYLFATVTQGKAFEMVFDLKPQSVSTVRTNIIHLANTSENSMEAGGRLPALWFSKGGTQLKIVTTKTKSKNLDYSGTSLPLNVYSNIKVVQHRNLADDYIFSLYVNGTEVFNGVIEAAQEWSNTKVYIGSPWSEPADAYMKNFVMRNLRDEG